MSDTSPTTQTLTDILDPARARAMEVTLGSSARIASGDPLPPFFHHLYFWDPVVSDDLGRDGHPRTGAFLPDLGLPRRMWAAGRLQFHRPLIAGTVADKISTVESVTRKDGRTGPLAFVKVRHDIRQRQGIALTEWQELVYRADPGPDAKPAEVPRARTDESFAMSMRFSSTDLFRYSALTFNGHRIHYDKGYARRVEGYENIVVHGPLLAQVLMLLATQQMGRPLATFSYRATAPLLAGEEADFCWADGAAWVRGPDGRQCLTAEAT